MISKFIAGFAFYFEGIRFWIQTKRLVKISVIPFLINVLIFIVGLGVSISKIPELTNYIVSKPEVWYQFFLYYFILILTSMALFVILVFVMSCVANLVAFPFNDILAHRTLTIKNALPEKPGSFLKNLSAMVKKTVIYLFIGGFMLLAMFLPGLGILGALIGVLLLAFDFLDYSFDHFNLSFKERKDSIRGHLSEFVGFAAGLGLTMAIPILNVLVMPGNVVAGACLVAKWRGTKVEGPNS